MRVFGLNKSGFSIPTKPEAIERFKTKTVRASATLIIGMP